MNQQEPNDYRGRCLICAFILDYFERRDINPETLLQDTGITRSFIKNPNNWIPVKKIHQILQNCYDVVPNLTLYDWEIITLNLQNSVVGNFFGGVTSLMGPKSMYMISERYMERSCNYQKLKPIQIIDGKADFVTSLEAEVRSKAVGCTFQITSGLLAAIPTSGGMSPGTPEILFDQAHLKNIMKKMYRRYGLSYQQKGEFVYINDKIIGRKIRLEEETVSGITVFSQNYSSTPPYNAILITDDLRFNDCILLRQGDIFDAPYGRIRIRWDETFDSSGFPNGFGKDTKMAKQTFLLLEEQIKLAEDRFFESERLREKEKKVFCKLKQANRILKEEISERKRTETLLKAREKDMEVQTANMQEANTALKVLLKKREEDKKKFSEKVLFNIKELIIPYLEKLKNTDLKPTQRAYVEILESNFEELSNPLALKLSFKYFDFTRAELRVAMLIRQGRTTQQIADLLKLSHRTIDAYRASIRKKLKIKNKKINLCTYLNSI